MIYRNYFHKPKFYVSHILHKPETAFITFQVQFSDSNFKFFCQVYFAEQFAALRQMVLPTGEEGYVRSLTRCIQWAARGGKSGSTFCKTRGVWKILPCHFGRNIAFNLLKPTGHVMHQQFNIQQLYALSALYLCVLYLSENKQRLVPLTA